MNKFSAPFKVKVSKTWKDKKKTKTEILAFSLVGMLVHRSFGPSLPTLQFSGSLDCSTVPIYTPWWRV